VEPSFRSPKIRYLETVARDALREIAAPPSGVEENNLARAFPEIAGVGETIDKICKFSFIYRQDGLVMLSPFRFYFLESALMPAEDGEVIHWGADCNPARGGMSFSLHVFCDCRMTHFQLRPTFAHGPPHYTREPNPPYTTPRRRGSSRESWIRRLQSVGRSEWNASDPSWPISLTVR